MSQERRQESASAALAAALAAMPALPRVPPEALCPLPVRGLAHAHWRVEGAEISGAPLLLRVPRNSFWGLAPAAALERQAAAFARAGPSGRTPRLHAVLPVSRALPFGALLVEEVPGAPPRLPRDLPAMADCLADIHLLPLPDAAARPPLPVHEDPFAATLAIAEAQAAGMQGAGLADAALRQIGDELDWARAFARGPRPPPPPLALAMTDTQPGNFVRRADGLMRFVDLEKALYGSPLVDLAHATLAPSIGWEAAAGGVDDAEAASFYRRWLDRAPQAERMLPWIEPFRRLVWLRTTTIFAVMRARHAKGEWSGGALDPAVRAHVLAHMARCHEPTAMAATRAEWLERGGIVRLL